MLRTVATWPSGGSTPCSRHQSAIRAGMSPAAGTAGRRHRRPRTGRRTSAAASSQRGEVVRHPRLRSGLARAARDPSRCAGSGCVPSTPPSLVKSATRASSVQHRRGRARARPGPRCRRRCTPRPASLIGTPTTADAVSWDPTAMTGVSAQVARRRRPLPSHGAGSTSSGSRVASSPTERRAARCPSRRSARRPGRSWRRWCARTRSRRSASTRAGRGSAAACSASARSLSATSW